MQSRADGYIHGYRHKHCCEKPNWYEYRRRNRIERALVECSSIGRPFVESSCFEVGEQYWDRSDNDGESNGDGQKLASYFNIQTSCKSLQLCRVSRMTLT